jgi:uncharacterized damage-inducible protein DinB
MPDPDYMAKMQGDDTSRTNAELLAAYTQDIETLSASVAGMTPAQVLARPIAGKWSTQEVVSHIADTEIYFTDRIIRTYAMDKPLLIAADERPYIERMNYQEFDLAEELALFSSLRRHAIRLLKRIPDEAWQRTAVHTGTGLMTIRQLVQQATRHLRHHLPFIEEKRAALTRAAH